MEMLIQALVIGFATTEVFREPAKRLDYLVLELKALA